MSDELTCSAKGCRNEASWAIRWNNPKLHSPDRRKVWVACGLHREELRDFLAMRGFVKDVVPVTELDPSDG
ncbi:hypothetical protein ACMYYO_07950 [Dermacoccaceae bacterium W4C1]